MSEAKYCGQKPGSLNLFKEAMTIEAKRIYDSCSE